MTTTAQGVKMSMGKRFFALLLIGFSIFLVFWEGLFSPFLLSDDYFLYYSPMGGGVYITTGRPTTYLFFLAYRAIYQHTGIQGVFIPRLIAAFGLLTLGFLLYKVFVSYRFQRPYAIFLACLLINLPGYIVYTLWISCNTYVFGSVFATCAFLLSDQAIHRDASRKRLLARSGAAIACLIFGLTCYQSAAMLFFSLIVLDLFMRTYRDRKRMVRLVAYKMMIGAVSMACYFVVFKAILLLLQTAPNDRVAFPDSISAKLKFFWGNVLELVLNMYNTFSTPQVEKFMGGLLVAGLLLLPFLKKGVSREYWIKLLALPLLLMISYTPNMITRDNYPPYRTLIAPTAVIVMLFAIIFYYFIRKMWPTLRNGVMIGVLLLILCNSHVLAMRDIVIPSTLELNYMVQSIGKQYLEKTRLGQKCDVIQFIPGGGLVPLEQCRFGEFGVYSASQEWNSNFAITLALEILHLKPSDFKFVRVTPETGEGLRNRPRVITVDMDIQKLFQHFSL